jgi:hypothetical protein
MKNRHEATKLVTKGLLFLITFAMVLLDGHVLLRILTYPLAFFRVFHIFWLLVVLLLLKRLFPAFNHKLSSGKAFARYYSPRQPDARNSRERLREVKGSADRGAIQSALCWLMVVAAIGALRAAGVLDLAWLIVIALFFVFMDQFCISVWCPFKWLTRAKCCNSCRINNWGYCMAFSPLVFYPSFWTYSLILLSLIVVAQWEYLYLRYPERFFEASNENLLCKLCALPSGCRKDGGKTI